MANKKVILMILDGLGITQNPEVSAPFNAKTPFIESLERDYPHASLRTDGEFVGLPDGQMGNSEVGHMNLGAGRVVYQNLVKINKAVREQTLNNEKVLVEAFAYAKQHQKKVHLLGLVSNGGIHSHINHLKGLLLAAKQHEVPNVFVHAFTDGRDCDPKSGVGFIEELQDYMKQTTGTLASIIGRYYAMDRDTNWERTEKAYNVIVKGAGTKTDNLLDSVKASYENNVTDEFILPLILNTEENTRIEEEDGVIFANFRPDRARQLTRAIVDKDFNGFNREEYLNTKFVCMAQYDIKIEAPVAYPPEKIVNGFGEVIAKNGLVQVRTAETEKYAHVTFFFNGGKEEPYEGEIRLLSHSPKVATYDLKPEMSAYEVKDNLIKELDKGYVDTVILNFANPDMVGHTGVVDAVVKACKAVDECLGEIVDKVLEMDGDILVTADHGNADLMVKPETGEPHTAHTTNPVPFILVSNKNKDVKLRKDGKLADIVPTMLELLNVEKPSEMDGESLIIR